MNDTVKQAHPARGVLWGLVFGIGLAFVLVVTTTITLDLVTVIVVIVAATIVGTLWSIFGPAKPPRGEPPRTSLPVDEPAVDEPAAALDDVDTGADSQE